MTSQVRENLMEKEDQMKVNQFWDGTSTPNFSAFTYPLIKPPNGVRTSSAFYNIEPSPVRDSSPPLVFWATPPISYHRHGIFNRLRDLLHRTVHKGPQYPNRETRDNLHLWLKILDTVSTHGVDINNITFTDPTMTTYSNARKQGMRDYNTDGLAWRYNLPPDSLGKFSINLLEFIASVFKIHLTITTANIPQKILAFTDISSALGWLHTTNFSSSQQIHNKVSRWLATTLMTHDSALYLQHIPGKYNIISDSLWRDKHLSNQQLTIAFHTLLPKQTPKSFNIQTLPPAIISWMQSLSQLSTKKPVSPKPPSKSKLGVLTNGADSCQIWALKMNSLRNSIEHQDHICCPRLRACAAEIIMAEQNNQFSKVGLPKPPSRIFVWTFGWTFGQTQF